MLATLSAGRRLSLFVGLIAAAALLLLAACDPSPAANATQPASTDCNQVRAQRGEGQVLDYDRACAVFASAKNAQLLHLVGVYLDISQEHFNSGMVRTLEFEDMIEALREGETQTFNLEFKGGVPYRLIGACDNECADIDVSITDSAGNVVEEDSLADKIPIVDFTPARDGRYNIVLQMFSCSVEPCYAGVRILESKTNWALEPNYETLNLTSGAFADPKWLDVLSGGDNDNQRRQSSCAGFITDRPDVRVNFTAAEDGLPLIISAGSRADTTLVINGPDGLWYCDNDGGVLGRNPMVVFSAPQGGQYDIWVGALRNSDIQPARLAISQHFGQ